MAESLVPARIHVILRFPPQRSWVNECIPRESPAALTAATPAATAFTATVLAAAALAPAAQAVTALAIAALAPAALSPAAFTVAGLGTRAAPFPKKPIFSSPQLPTHCPSSVRILEATSDC